MVSAAEQSSLNEFEQRVLMMAYECRAEIVNEFNNILLKNELSFNQLFDTFYIPIANTNPQKFNTQYDKLTDDRLRIILDKYLAKDKRLLYVVAVDRNGYVPTHNSIYSKPLTNDEEYNAVNNRTKRLFNDRTGLAAARNTEAFLLQKYERDTGEVFYDLSVPIILKEKHWGAVRIGFKN
jgi:methyl-accepting chemotaxis protein